MSNRSSFTSEYIYSREDYKTIRKRANECGNDKYLNFAPPASWSNGKETFEMPIISGKVGAFFRGEEVNILREFLESFKVNNPVTFIIIPEGHDFEANPLPIIKMTKQPNGDIDIFTTKTFEKWEY